jgi:hypothetical protein
MNVTMFTLYLLLLNFFGGLACCDDATNPGSCELITSTSEVFGCPPALDVELGWCDGALADPGTVCEPLVPHVGDLRCCPILEGFVVDTSDCRFPLGEATIDDVTHVACDGAAEAVACVDWTEPSAGVFVCG